MIRHALRIRRHIATAAAVTYVTRIIGEYSNDVGFGQRRVNTPNMQDSRTTGRIAGILLAEKFRRTRLSPDENGKRPYIYRKK